MESEPRPRHCFLIKGECGYGFHLHGERNKVGQFIRKVEPGSSAELAGLRAGDRVVEVNGENVEHETHHQVVSRIRATETRTRLLVVDRETDELLQSRGSACTEDIAVEMGTLSPRPSPMTTPSASPVPREGGALSPKLQMRASPLRTRVYGQNKGSPLTSRSETNIELPDEPSPEPAEPTATLLPRLCHLLKGESGYGFNLHNDKTRGGQFIRSVDPGSAAQGADIRPGDRLVEVNGVNIERLKHSQVVELIRSTREEVRLLLVDEETDRLFQRLGITPTTMHVKEVYVDEVVPENMPPTPPATEVSDSDLPIINIALSNAPMTNESPKSRTNGSSASQSSRSSTTQSEFSSSDMSIQVPDEDDRRISDPFAENGLRLSPTAAEARRKVHDNRSKKRAPPMDWSKKHELFSNF